MKQLLFALLFIAPCINAMELINPSAVSSASDLKLLANHRDLFVEDENAAYRVERSDMNPLLREVMHRKALGQFVGDGYIRVNKLDEGKYALMAKVRGNGGGAVCAWYAYCFAKGTIYGSLAAGAGVAAAGAVTAVAGSAVAGTVAGAVVAKTGSAAAALGSTAGGLAGSIAGGGVGAGIIAAGGGEAVALTAGSIAASTGTAAGVVALIECASVGFASFFAVPWLP